MRPFDILVLAKLIAGHSPSVRALSVSIDSDKSTTSRSLARLRESSLVFEDEVDGTRTLEFLEHGVKYIVPAKVEEKLVYGVVTGVDVPPLSDGFAATSAPLVWKHRPGERRGRPIKPLTPSVPALALEDPSLHSVLAAIDAFRVGRARERRAARDYLTQQLDRRGAFVNVA